MTDRRRINPLGGTAPPVFASSPTSKTSSPAMRVRAPDELRKICGSCITIRNLPISCTDSRMKCSPENGFDTLSIRFGIFRTQTIHTDCSEKTLCKKSTSSQTHMHCPWSSTSSQICAILASASTLHSYQVCTFRGSTTERLHSRRWRTRSCRSP